MRRHKQSGISTPDHSRLTKERLFGAGSPQLSRANDWSQPTGDSAPPDTRTCILDAARNLFVTLGYGRVTMRKIAQAIGYTPTTIYLYFKDKQALLRELVVGDFLAMTARFQEIAGVADPAERLRAIGLAYVEYGLAFPNHYRLIFFTDQIPALDECGPIPEVERGNPERDAYAFLTHTVQACIDSGRLRPEFNDAEQTAQMLWSAVHGVVSLYISKSHDTWLTWKPPMDTARLMIDTLTNGLLAPASPPSHSSPSQSTDG